MNSSPSSTNLTDSALQVLRKRILRRDDSGNPIETPDEMFLRVASAVAEAENKYHGEKEVKEVTESFRIVMKALEFLPNSPTLINAGIPGGQLSGCFVLPIEDSIESIYGTLKEMAVIQKTGGGTGFSFSRLRPRDDFISSTRGKSSGPVSFLKVYNFACEENRRGGVRQGANMGVMRFDHPDILDFITAKNDIDSLRTFNLSVGVTDYFMECVKHSSSYPLINPRNGKVERHLNARQVFDAIVMSAWKTGDPGLVFLDAINEHNPTPFIGQIEATNPCGEQPLLPYESCNLGSINVSMFYENGQINFQRLDGVVRLAVRFLDDVVEVNSYPIPQIDKITKGNRKIGLGVMGFADLLLLLDIPYDSDEANAVGDKIMTTVSEAAKEQSRELADERGVFPNFYMSIFPSLGIKQRNATLTTIAPTGTISMIAGCSSGIEPLFAICYIRQMFGEEREFSIHPLFERKAALYLNDDIRDQISRTGSVKGIKDIPESIRRVYVSAHDISPEWHVRTQAAFQRHVDSAVSKTVNLNKEASPEDIAKVYVMAHELRCKGITVFRDGCKGEQVLRSGKKEMPMLPGALVCPECGGPMEHASACLTCISCGYTLCTI